MLEPTHTLNKFAGALAALRSNALMMASLTARNLQNAFDCLLNRDLERCAVAIADEDEIDSLRKDIDAEGMEILTLFRPVALDLRQIISTMRFAASVERVADQATKIARRGRKLSRARSIADTDSLEPIFLEAMLLFRDSVRAFTDNDVDLARSIRQRDRGLDGMKRRVEQMLTAQMSVDGERVADGLDLIFVARHLERIGDHAKHIAEESVYAAVGEDIRYGNNLLQIRANENPVFRRRSP